MRRRRRQIGPPRPSRRPRPPVPPPVRRRFLRAQRFIEQGNFIEAAGIYERLARAAYDRARVRPGLHMSLEAVRCYLLADDVERAKAIVLQVAQRAKDLGLPKLCWPLVDRIVQRLEAEGLDSESFREEITAVLGSFEAQPVPEIGRHAAQKSLPGSCPACSAPLHPEEIDWVAEDRVACPYCGSIVVAE